MKNKNELKEIMRSHKEQTKCMGLPIFLGYDDNNQPLIVDLAKVGNILVGGQRGRVKPTYCTPLHNQSTMHHERCLRGVLSSISTPKGWMVVAPISTHI